jgi:hypothetical protein
MLMAHRFIGLYPKKGQKVTFFECFNCSRVVWNKSLELRKEHCKEHKYGSLKKGSKPVKPLMVAEVHAL